MHNDSLCFYVHQVKLRKQHVVSVSSSDMFLLKNEFSQSKGRKALKILNYHCNSHPFSLHKRQMQCMLMLRKKFTVFSTNRVDIYG